MRSENSEPEVAVTFRLPRRLRERADARIAGRYASTSEYIRDLIRRDLEEEPGDREGRPSRIHLPAGGH